MPSTAYQGAQTLNIYMIWMWDAEWGSLQPQPWVYGINRDKLYSDFPKISPPSCKRCIGIRVHPCTHLQHIKVLKHFIYIWYGYGMQSGVVCSLNHDYRALLGLNCISIFQKSPPHPAKMYQHKGAPICHLQHIKVLKHFIYIWYGFEMQSGAVYNLNHECTASIGLNCTPIFQKSPPHPVKDVSA